MQYEASEQQFAKITQNLTDTVSTTMSEGFAMMQMMMQPAMPNKYNIASYSSQTHGGGMYNHHLPNLQSINTCSDSTANPLVEYLRQ